MEWYYFKFANESYLRTDLLNNATLDNRLFDCTNNISNNHNTLEYFQFEDENNDKAKMIKASAE